LNLTLAVGDVFQPFAVTTNAAYSSYALSHPESYNAGWELCAKVNNAPGNRVFYVSCKNQDGTEKHPFTNQLGIYALGNGRFLFTEIEIYEYDDQSSKLTFYIIKVYVTNK